MPDLPLNSVLRDQAFEEIAGQSDLAASYARSVGEAAYRGDQLETFTHLKQLRLCCIAMLKTYNEYLANGQGVAEASDPHHGGADKRSGDGVA